MTHVLVPLACLLLLGPAFASAQEANPADARLPDARLLLANAIAVLPREPITLDGSLAVRRERGKVLAERNYRMTLDFGAVPPRAAYELRDAFGNLTERLEVTREGPVASLALFRGDPPEPAPTPALNARVSTTDVTWMDLTLDFLWWTDARCEGEDSVKGRDCYVVVAAPPEPIPGCTAVRLWLDKEVGFLLRAEQLDPQGEPSRRMWVRSVKQVRERWIIGTMEIDTVKSNHRTRLRVEDWNTP
ncbi:MAG: outer membrane lipoprotein-sorting protein [Kiritimatiellia bacterium]|jgi:hypothetical protein